MDTYAFDGTSTDATMSDGLRGSAKYTGGATGVYVDGLRNGLFTAEATLTANFDVNSDGDADTGDYSISGRIDNFRGTDGVFLGTIRRPIPTIRTPAERTTGSSC